MTGQSKTLVIWFLFILQNITCSPVTILLGERDRQCFYIEVKDAEYTAKVVLLSGGSVGFSEKPPGSKSFREEKIDMIPVDLSEPFEHPLPEKNGEHEICLFSDRRFGREVKHVILDIAKDEGVDPILKSMDDDDVDPILKSMDDDDVDPILKSIEDVEASVSAIMAEQNEKENRIIRRNQAANDNHSSMEQSSLMETVVLVVVSVGQIIFVRSWFQGKGTLLKQWA